MAAVKKFGKYKQRPLNFAEQILEQFAEGSFAEGCYSRARIKVVTVLVLHMKLILKLILPFCGSFMSPNKTIQGYFTNI